MNPRLSRRSLLLGSGVALCLPWLPSLVPRSLRAQSGLAPRRFLPIFLPNGAGDRWRPTTAGQRDAWALSPELEPFGASLKRKLTVLSDLEQGSVFHVDADPFIDPSHAPLAGAWLSCVNAAALRARLNVSEANGVTVDQKLAQHLALQEQRALPSLQLGLSTPLSGCDGEPCSLSRSVSWATETQPLYKLVDPLEAFQRIVGVTGETQVGPGAAEAARKRAARESSVLDAVRENAEQTRQQAGSADRRRLDEFLESVRAAEVRASAVSAGMGGLACKTAAEPTMRRVEQSAQAPQQTTEHYDKGTHADAMNALITMAFECDATRVITYMLEDERSDFVYDHVEERLFTDASSSPIGRPCQGYHQSQHIGGDRFSSITWWNVSKVADLCRRLDAIEEAPGVSVLDNCVVLFSGCMEGGSHAGRALPTTLLGGSNLGLHNDQHVVFNERPLRDLYFTLLNEVFAVGVDDFGQNLTGAPPSVISELLKA